MTVDRDRRDAVVELMRAGQRALLIELTSCDGRAEFVRHEWQRPGGGGGTARVAENGAVFERAGVNVSAVHGERAPAALGIGDHTGFFAAGISVVIHPRNPYVPSFHANFRYFEIDGQREWWFGGGADLTPSYGFESDAEHFHRTLKSLCDGIDQDFYANAKKACDEYFYLPHRREARGVGGIFFDRLRLPDADGWQRSFDFVAAGVETLAPSYLPIVHRRSGLPYGRQERQWQLYRRGRYAEFNLLYDRGTRFGLETGGNIEAIFMSLPPHASWEFDRTPPAGSQEARLAEFLRPRDWAGAPAEHPPAWEAV